MGRIALVMTVLVILGWAVVHSGSFLVVDAPQPSDAIVVPAGDTNDVRYWHAVRLARDHYAPRLLLSASEDTVQYGNMPAQQAREFLARTAPDLVERASVCGYRGDSTFVEARFIASCLDRMPVRSVLLVTSDFHSRRALAIFRRVLPRYRWSVAAVPDPTEFSSRWWERRRWAKTSLQEWEKLVWWYLVERW